MSLPVISAPKYETLLPSTGKKINFRPFTVREEKSLLIAQQSEDVNTMINTLKDVIQECTYKTLDIESLALFDLEYLFLQIRGKSIGEEVQLNFSCDACGEEFNVGLDLTKVQVKKDPNHTNKIQITDKIGIVMKYPGIKDLEKIKTMDETNLDEVIGVVCSQMDMVWDGDNVHYVKDSTQKETEDFLLSLNEKQFTKIKEFFETTPKVSHRLEFTCPKCNKEHFSIIEGIKDFF